MNIWLPVAEAGEAQEAQEASRPDVNKRKVLLIDDEKMIRKMGKRMLEAAGYEVVVADGGNAALEIFKSRTDGFGLVLLDLSMPVMDGAECFEKLKEIDPSVRVLICTGHGSPGDIKKMVGDGVLGVVRKPFDLEQLSEAIDGAMCER